VLTYEAPDLSNSLRQKKQLVTLIDMMGLFAPSKKSSQTRDGFASTRDERATRSVHLRHRCLLSKNWLSKSEKWSKTFEETFGFMSAKYSGIDGYVGDTPLIRLQRLSKLTRCEILGKAEFMNPGGSVKDRAAYGIITNGEKAGQLKPGATIVEGTAGNTGIGLAVIGRARGYSTVIVIPNNQSPEKMHLLRTLGAEVKAVPEKPYKDPENYNHIARRLAEERSWFWANQFDNTANRDAHYRSTGPEIWKQTEGKITAFVAAVGTGGTLAGVSSYLKEQNPNIQIVCADPYGAAMWSWFTNGDLETNDGDSIAEGIGQGRVTRNIEGIKVDRAYRIPDQIGLTIVYQLLREEGLFLGLSSGINVAGALRFAKESGPGQTIVTILCDSGQKYQSTLFNRDWLASNHLDPDLPLESVLEW
jgi:cysteine synthase